MAQYDGVCDNCGEVDCSPQYDDGWWVCDECFEGEYEAECWEEEDDEDY
jgi:formylmethanofuran dehydrogenase subunit E